MMSNQENKGNHSIDRVWVGLTRLIIWLEASRQRRTPLRLLKLSLLTLGAAAITVHSLSMPRVSAYSTGPPPSYTGAPGEETCVSCHSSFPLNSGGGTLTITGLPANYSPGQEVNITITLTQSDRALYGFQATAVDDAGRQAGTLLVTDPARTQTVIGAVGGGRTYIEHTRSGANPGGANQGSWTFRWRAPGAGAGRVTFYAVGNAANGDGSTSGDFIYTATAVTLPEQPAPTPVISGLNPNTAAAGGPAFTLIVTGANFVSGSIVRWNNANRITSAVSGIRLAASIPAADLTVAGTASVTVVNPGGATSNAVTFTIAVSGAEADVTPRGNTNGAVTTTDWAQVGRFAAGLDAANQGSEFQRADCAPRETSGDGQFTIADWTQAGRYAAGLDAIAPAAGPTSPISATTGAAGDERRVSSLEVFSETGAPPKRIVRAAPASIHSERIIARIIQLDARGDESALGFSLNYDPNRLRFAGAALSQELSHAAVIINAEQAENGRIGVMLSLPAGQSWPPGMWSLMAIHFIALADGALAESEVSFGDDPVAREIADVEANRLPATFEQAGDRSSMDSAASDSPKKLAAEALATAGVTAPVLLSEFAMPRSASRYISSTVSRRDDCNYLRCTTRPTDGRRRRAGDSTVS